MLPESSKIAVILFLSSLFPSTNALPRDFLIKQKTTPFEEQELLIEQSKFLQGQISRVENTVCAKNIYRCAEVSDVKDATMKVFNQKYSLFSQLKMIVGCPELLPKHSGLVQDAIDFFQEFSMYHSLPEASSEESSYSSFECPFEFCFLLEMICRRNEF